MHDRTGIVLGMVIGSERDGAQGWLVYTVVAAGALTSLLTLYAVARIWNVAFWRSPLEAENPEPVLLDPSPKGALPQTMVAATAVLAKVRKVPGNHVAGTDQ